MYKIIFIFLFFSCCDDVNSKTVYDGEFKCEFLDMQHGIAVYRCRYKDEVCYRFAHDIRELSCFQRRN